MADDVNKDDTTDLIDDSSSDTQDTQDTQDTASKATKTAVSDPELLKAIQDLSTSVKSGQKQEDRQELTEEQKEEMWGVFKPEKARPDFIKKFFNLPDDASTDLINEKRELLGYLQEGLVKQSLIGATNFQKIALKEIEDKFTPIKEYVSKAEAKERDREFHETYPALKDPKYKKIVELTQKQLKRETFKDEPEYFKAVAEAAAESIQAIVPDFDLGATKEAKPKPAGTTPRVPRSTAGGTGGTGGGGGGNGVAQRANSIDALS